jgi:hypothetical protein
VRALHVVGVDLELWLGEELASARRGGAPGELVAVGLLRAGLDEDLALEDAGGARAQDLLEDLAAFAGLARMGHEDGVVVVEVAVADRSPRDMRLGVVAQELDDDLVAGEDAIEGEREGTESERSATRAKIWVAVRRWWSRPWVRTWWRIPPSATSTSVTLLKRAAAGPLSSSMRLAPGSTFKTWWSIASEVSATWW